jgi:hypothetical protein
LLSGFLLVTLNEGTTYKKNVEGNTLVLIFDLKLQIQKLKIYSMVLAPAIDICLWEFLALT